ncbi:hypothetical protein AL035_21320, partial [Salipiger aestuarii]
MSQKITLSASRDIPFDKLVLSQSNVRRIKVGVSIEELAEHIARRTRLSSITVRPVLDEDGAETGMFEIPARGRRYRALELLVKQKPLIRVEDPGAPGRANASATASMQKPASSVIDTRQARTRRVNQSRTAARQMNPRAIHCPAGDLHGKSAERGNAGDVHRPDLVGPDDGRFPKKIGIDLVSRRWFRGIRLAIERLDAHALHHGGNVQPPDLEPFLNQQAPQHPAARKGKFHVQLVDPAHQLQIGVRHRALPRLIASTLVSRSTL